MKKTMILAVACLGAAMSVASAQTLEAVHVNLPMDAKVGKVSLPAGEYSITAVNHSVLEIKSDAKHGPSVFVSVNSAAMKNGSTANQTKVVLKKEAEGDAYQIQSIWLEGQDLGFEFAGE